MSYVLEIHRQETVCSHAGCELVYLAHWPFFFSMGVLATWEALSASGPPL